MSGRVRCENCGEYFEKSGGLVGSTKQCPNCGYTQIA